MSKMIPEFETGKDELDFLRYAVGHLMCDPGALTANGAASRELGYDLLEEYYKDILLPSYG